jgi:hypothetical protein
MMAKSSRKEVSLLHASSAVRPTVAERSYAPNWCGGYMVITW